MIITFVILVIKGHSKSKKFIATQGIISIHATKRLVIQYTSGPKDYMLVDFWRLVWQERPPTIVMVTNLKEGHKKKCEQYWPDSGGKEFGPFKVTLTEQQVSADYTTRTMQVAVSFHNGIYPDVICINNIAVNRICYTRPCSYMCYICVSIYASTFNMFTFHLKIVYQLLVHKCLHVFTLINDLTICLTFNILMPTCLLKQNNGCAVGGLKWKATESEAVPFYILA